VADDLADELGALLRLKESTADAVTRLSKHFPRDQIQVCRELNRAVAEVLPEVLSTIDTGNLIRQYSVRHSIADAPRNGKAITLTYQSAQPPNPEDVRGDF
jgi:flagellar biosynthesis/type III secretory pathway protein FliH